MGTSDEQVIKLLSDAGSELSRKLSAGKTADWTALLEEHFEKAQRALGKAVSGLSADRVKALAFSAVVCSLNLKLHEDLKGRLKKDGEHLPQSIAYRLVDLWGNIVGTRSLLRDIAVKRSGEPAESRARESVVTGLAEENLRAVLFELSKLGCLSDYAAVADWAANARDKHALPTRAEVRSYINSLAA